MNRYAIIVAYVLKNHDKKSSYQNCDLSILHQKTDYGKTFTEFPIGCTLAFQCDPPLQTPS